MLDESEAFKQAGLKVELCRSGKAGSKRRSVWGSKRGSVWNGAKIRRFWEPFSVGGFGGADCRFGALAG